MGFFDIIAPTWTNLIREGELQKLDMARQSALLSQSPYFRAWAENNPNSNLAKSIAHIAGWPKAGGPGVPYTGGGVPPPTGSNAPLGTPDMGSSAWQRQSSPTQPLPPATDPGVNLAPGATYAPQSSPYAQGGAAGGPRLIGPTGPSYYKYPQTADTPENVAMEHTKAQTGLTGAEEGLKRAQARRIGSMGGGGAGQPGYVMKGYTIDEMGNVKENWEKSDPSTVSEVPAGTLPRTPGRAKGGNAPPAGPTRGGAAGAAPTLPPPAAAPTKPPITQPTANVRKPAGGAPTAGGAAIPTDVLDKDRELFGLTPPTQPGESGAPAPSAPAQAPGAPTAGVTPPPAAPPGAPGAAPLGGYGGAQAGVPAGTAPVSGPGAAAAGGAPTLVDVFGEPVTYTAPHAPPSGSGQAQQLAPGGPLLVEKEPQVGQARLDILDSLAEHSAVVYQSIQKYGRKRAATIPANAALIDKALAANKARARGAPSLAGQTAHLTSSLNLVTYLAQPVKMPMQLDDGTKLPPEIAGKTMDPFTVLTHSPFYATFGKKVPILGDIAGPTWGLSMAESKGDPRARRISAYSGAVQSIVKGLGDVGNLSEGEQRTVANQLLPSGNSTEWEARGRQQQLVQFLSIIREGLIEAQRTGGTNVHGANAVRRVFALPEIDQWSIDRDNSRQGVQAGPNVLGAQPAEEATTIAPAGAP